MNVFNNNKGRRLYFAAYFIAVKIYNFYLFLQNLYDVSGQNFTAPPLGAEGHIFMNFLIIYVSAYDARARFGRGFQTVVHGGAGCVSF